MSNIQTQHIYRVDLDHCPLRAELERPLSHTDALADEFIIHVRRGMTPADLTGMSVLGCITWEGRQTLAMSGMIDVTRPSAATLTLPEEAYTFPGAFTLTVQLTDGDIRHTLLHLEGQIVRTSSDTLIPAGDVLPTLPEFLQHMENMNVATSAALDAAAQACNAADELTARVATSLSDCAEAIQAAGPAILNNTDGKIAFCTDAAARTAVQLASTISPAQPGTGDPSPDNVRPISGWDAVALTRTGKNLLGFKDFATTGTSFSDTCVNNVFSRKVTGAHSTTYAVGATGFNNIENPHIPAGTYTFTLTHMSDVKFLRPYLEVTLSDGSIVNLENGVATTLLLDGIITGVRMASSRFENGDVIEFVMQLEAGAGTEYEPYNGVTLTAALPETVYGGTLDWTTGLLTVTHFAQTLDGTESWVQGTLSGEAVPVFYGDDMLTRAVADNKGFYHLCSHYKPAVYRDSDVQTDKSCYTVNGRRLLFKDTAHSTVDAWKAYLAAQAAAGTPVTIVHPFREQYSYTIQLTPQQLDMLKGCNAARSDTGDTSLVYVADTKMYIDNAIAAIAASIPTA